jgi:hypothetical protein
MNNLKIEANFILAIRCYCNKDIAHSIILFSTARYLCILMTSCIYKFNAILGKRK